MNNSQKVPFVDLYAQYLSIKGEIDHAIERTIKESSYIGGKPVVGFEQEFAQYCKLPYVISCGNGTDSIEILLKASGIGAGDEVIVPAITWISSAEAVTAIGAKPVFVDIEADYFTINPALIEAAITPRTKAIIPVHLYGHPADMPAIMEIARKHNLFVLEDCAQSHGAAINGQLAGTFGHAASFSFYPGKNLGAYGDAGAMATADQALAEKARMIANHGQQGKHNHLMEGRNSRLDGLQAAILSAKLPHLDKWTEMRINNASRYDAVLQSIGKVQSPKVKEGYKHVFHLYVLKVNERENLQKKLAASGIDTAIHYPTALPFLACYSHYGHVPNDFPVAHANQQNILSIPMYAELTNEQISYIAGVIGEN
ncbi:DegT/DnrJ/EryC1/StrS family aminotransferase [Flavihumibacter petaseus]|uniref:Aminotransferase n=1 Tax=Flavihumibacter petaseus NBRC 106054 TaxID=1220578 RepID=A0A0E9N5W6_9BACT|nr:DegT/DnrJ/EryC1/StrS family aminotransferase [Flavihumibacter petaseus]GAO45214.1 aminotransferase [Flavihumibacter petaseus NBRC 106054]